MLQQSFSIWPFGRVLSQDEIDEILQLWRTFLHLKVISDDSVELNAIFDSEGIL
jgi:hypothetical protein